MSPGPGSTSDISEVDIQEYAEYGSGNIGIVAASGAAQALPLADVATTSLITLTAACALTVPAPNVVGEKRRIYLQQDGTGSRTVTWTATGGTIRWSGGAAPTLTTGANKIDYIELESLDGTNWLGSVKLNF